MSDAVYSLKNLGEPIFTSRSSEIFNWEDDKLLKLFRPEVDHELIINEEINTRETFNSGVSKVECFGRVKVDEREGIIIRRVPGKTLISLAGSKPLTAFAVHELMADLQIAMHCAHNDKIRNYKQFVIDALDSEPMSFLSAEEKAICTDKLEALPDGDSILHLDFHPDNIMSDGKYDTTIIDWMTAASGAPAADVAATLFLLNEGEMIPGMSKLAAMVLEAIRKLVCKKYYASYKKKTGMTDAEIAVWRLPFLIFRLSIWNIESEIKSLQEKIRAELAK